MTIKLPTLKFNRDFTLVANALFIALSNCKSTLIANWGVIWPSYKQEIKLSMQTHQIKIKKYGS